jgi:hypothetical protein
MRRYFIPFLFIGMLLLGACASADNAPTFSVSIDNQSQHEICSVRFHIAGSYHMPAKNSLRESWFKKRRILAGEQMTLWVSQGVYDIRLETCDGLVTGTDYFSIPGDASWTITDEMLFVPVR